MKNRRYVLASVIALAGFSALFAVLPSEGSGREVALRGNQFNPTTIRIPAGGAITFENEDRLNHTADCQGEGCPRSTGDIQPGTIRTVTFRSEGTYHLVCRYHGELGMIATVTVGSGGPPSSPSPSASPTS